MRPFMRWGSILAEHMFEALRGSIAEHISTEAYAQALSKLTATSWRSSGWSGDQLVAASGSWRPLTYIRLITPRVIEKARPQARSCCDGTGGLTESAGLLTAARFWPYFTRTLQRGEWHSTHRAPIETCMRAACGAQQLNLHALLPVGPSLPGIDDRADAVCMAFGAPMSTAEIWTRL